MINKDLIPIEQLINILNKATEDYDKGHPTMSDVEWDNLYYTLKEREDNGEPIYPNSPTQTIHYEIVNNLNKITHNHKMLSLAKTKDWNEFLQYFKDKDVIGMLKLDGLTCSLEYQDGQLIKAETRGDGIIGEDILHNAKVIASIPQRIAYQDHLVIDGEIICTDGDFAEFANEYANSRNFASGSIRLLDSKECAKRKLTFIAWNVIFGYEEENSFLKRLISIEKLGFKVVPWTSSFDLDAKEFLIDEAKKLGYPIDGLVGRFDDINYGTSLGETSHHTRAAMAFKFFDETYPTKLINIEWGMGRTGILTPIAKFEPINMEDSIVEKASLHNISVMTELMGKPYVGQSIEVFKANAIIPQVYWASNEKSQNYIEIPKVCPYCGEKTKVFENNDVKVLKCTNPNCQEKAINKFDHYCGTKGLEIKGLSKATLEKLLDWGWIETIKDLYTLSQYKKDWINKEGFGIKSVNNILAAIEKSKECTLEKFLAALGIPHIGLSNTKIICKHINTYEEFKKLIDEKYDFSDWDTFGYEKTNSLLTFDYTIADYVYSNYIIIKNNKQQLNTNQLNDIKICVTGSLKVYKNRKAIQTDIENAGGKLVSSVTKNTNYLINNDKESMSVKNLKAKELNIPILSEQEFINKFLTK